MSNPETTTWQSEFFADRQDDHPWYGPCDGLLADGGCAECAAVRFDPGYAEARAEWWAETMRRWGVGADRRARRKERRLAKDIARMDREVEEHLNG